jgi:hypothetical protein
MTMFMFWSLHPQSVFPVPALRRVGRQGHVDVVTGEKTHVLAGDRTLTVQSPQSHSAELRRGWKYTFQQ